MDAQLLGQRVVLGGLSSRPELNGRRGVARSFEGGRYAVALEGSGESVRVRPGNLWQRFFFLGRSIKPRQLARLSFHSDRPQKPRCGVRLP